MNIQAAIESLGLGWTVTKVGKNSLATWDGRSMRLFLNEEHLQKHLLIRSQIKSTGNYRGLNLETADRILAKEILGGVK